MSMNQKFIPSDINSKIDKYKHFVPEKVDI